MKAHLFTLVFTVFSLPALANVNAEKASCEISLSTNELDRATGNPYQKFIDRTFEINLNKKNGDYLKDITLGRDHTVRVRIMHNQKDNYYTLMTYIRNRQSTTSDFYSVTSGQKKDKQALNLNVSTLNIKALNFAEEHGPFSSYEEIVDAQKQVTDSKLMSIGEWANAAVVCSFK